jgi:hypothetical protein
MNTLRSYRLRNATGAYFLNALDHDSIDVLSDLAGDTKMVLPDLVTNVGSDFPRTTVRSTPPRGPRIS